MKYSPYSASRIALWNQCPRSFKYSYIDKIPREPQDDTPLKKGFCTHLFLENHTAKFSKEKILKEIKKEKIPKEIVIESKRIYNDFIQSSLGKKIFSYFPLGAELDVGLKIENKNIVTCDFLDPDCVFRGKIDYVCVDRETDKVFIIDWKTGKDRSAGQFAQKPDQLIYYAAWYFHNFPVDEIELMYVFVEHGTFSTYTMKRENLNTYIKFLLKNIRNIEVDSRFEKHITKLCDYCGWKKYCDGDR